MAFWWVNQNKSYKQEREGGFLWAPEKDKSGTFVPSHWECVSDVRSNDVVFSYVGKKIVTVSIAIADAYRAPKPESLRSESQWETNGRKVDVRYQDLAVPIRVEDIVHALTPLLADKYSPLNVNNTGNQGYLYPLPEKAGNFLLTCCDGAVRTATDDIATDVIKNKPGLPDTMRWALVRSREGQGQYRDDLKDLWQSRCAVTGCAVVSMLIASHSKPWSLSTDPEKLDRYNGFLLSPAYDSAFDKGLITFTDEGKILLSKELPAEEAIKIGINPLATLRSVSPKHLPYLEYHRENRFRGAE